METILKWIKNDQVAEDAVDAQNYVISRTMLKIAVVNKFMLRSKGVQLPQNGELWRCRIVKETQQNQNKGCFIVDPLEKIDENDLVKLIPGMFDAKLVGRTLVIRPHAQYCGQNWILPLQHKKLLSDEHDAYSLIVDISPLPVDTTQASTSGPKVFQ